MATTPWKRPGVLLAAAGVYIGSTAFAYLTFVEPKADASLDDVTDARRVQVFNQNATKYDKGTCPAHDALVVVDRLRSLRPEHGTLTYCICALLV